MEEIYTFCIFRYEEAFMKKRGYQRNRSLLGLFLVAIVLVSSVFTTRIVAEDTVADESYFVVEKTWENDLESQRPTSITIHIVGDDGSDRTATLTKAEGWKKEFTLPAVKDGKAVNYSVYEEMTGLDAYASNATKEKPLAISNTATIKKTEHTGKKYVLNESKVANAPEGTIVIDSNLVIKEAVDAGNVTMSDNFTFMESCKIYGNSSGITNSFPRIAYTGNVSRGDNRVGNVVLLWKNKATNTVTGETYDVRISLNNIVLRSLVDIDNSGDAVDRYIAILSNQDNMLHMQSYVGPNFDTSNLKKNIVGVKADIKIEILDNNSPADGTVRVLIADIDMPDFAKFYDDGKDGWPGTDVSYWGLGKEYVESVDLTSGVKSDIYVASDTVLDCYEDNDNSMKLAATTDSVGTERKSLAFLADSSYGYTWTGSNCGTTIIQKGDAPAIKNVTNTISNVSSRYKIEYYYQVEDENGVHYEKTPDYSTDEYAVPPKTYEEVSKDDKTPLEEKKKLGYVLDESMNGDWSGTTSDDPTKNPLVLKVYFKKTYVVIYHDNVDDKIWNPDDQTNPGLDYKDPTPGFKGTPQRQGYDFVGWSKDDPKIDPTGVDAEVLKNTDYWAHWVPGDNKYQVWYYYEVNGKYPEVPDFKSDDRPAKTEDKVSVTDADKVPQKQYYKLSSDMTVEWTGIVLPDGSLVLKVYFRRVPVPVTPSYVAPVTGVE